MDSRLLFEQISPDKNVNCLCTTAPFTVSLEPEGFVVACQLVPKISAFYDGSVRPLTDLPLLPSQCRITYKSEDN